MPAVQQDLHNVTNRMFHLYLEDNLQQYTAAQIENIIATFPPQRREVAMRYKFEQGRKESALAYQLLCQGLKEHYGIEKMPSFSIGEHGKPSLAEHPEIHFNFSHCKHAVICALSDAPIGVDVERIGRYREELARHCMNEQEMTEIQSSPNREVTFTRLWTQKEALVKLKGTGITDDLPNILCHNGKIQIETVVNEEKGYVYSVATFMSES